MPDALEAELCRHPSAGINAIFRSIHPTLFPSVHDSLLSAVLTELLVGPCCKLGQASILLEKKKQMCIFGVLRSRSRHSLQRVVLICMKRLFAVV